MRQVPRPTGFDRAQAIAARVAAAAALVAGVLMGAAQLPSPARWVQAADIVTPLTGHVLIGTIAVVLALIWRRRAVPILLASVVLALTLHTALSRQQQVKNLWPPTSVDAARDHLRIYELNSWDENEDLPRLERALQAVGADVIVLAEVDLDKAQIFARLKAQFPYQVSCAEQSVCAMAILSRLPIVAGAAGRKASLVPPLAWARIDAGTRGMGMVTVIGTHVHRPTRDPWIHAHHMQALSQIIRSTKGPVILAGDLNTGPWSASFQQLVRSTGLEPSARLLPTWPAYPIAMPQVAIDHIMVSPELLVRRSGIAPATGSDHLPVFAEVGLRAPARLSAR